MFELDHLFICTDVGADEASRLVSLGWQEGTANIHPGQGTANRRFFFHNAMLEFLWVYDSQEANSERIRPIQLGQRWTQRNTGACPFGICLRQKIGSDDASNHTTAFSSWAYHPPYLPPTVSIAVANNSEVLTEPMLFQIPWGQRPDQYPADKAQPLNHRQGFREITRVELASSAAKTLSPELQAVVSTQLIKLREGEDYFMELGFDEELQGQRADFRPGLPLMICW